MKISFTKMQGCGNSYIYVDCFNQSVNNPAAFARKVSDVHTGIGADGLILILPSFTADARMRIFNADGSEGAMCGNGIRCVAKYLYDNHLVRSTHIKIETASGIRALTLQLVAGQVKKVMVDMGAPCFEPGRVPMVGFLRPVINSQITVQGYPYTVTALNIGNPHCVLFCKDVDKLNLERLAPAFGRSGIFPQGVNVEFVQVLAQGKLKMRVFERGSGETFGCGSGSCAAAVAAIATSRALRNTDITVQQPGGTVTVRYTDTVLLIGDACTVCSGTIEDY
ncbi:MAG: diaminopimelate epimerase [Oscillospiraceae bacterium]|nr:diaminopimelate epimerase [Oscillospiraceae bacterium]